MKQNDEIENDENEKNENILRDESRLSSRFSILHENVIRLNSSSKFDFSFRRNRTNIDHVDFNVEFNIQRRNKVANRYYEQKRNQKILKANR